MVSFHRGSSVLSSVRVEALCAPTRTRQYGSDRPLESAARSRRAPITCTIRLRPPNALVGCGVAASAAAGPPGGEPEPESVASGVEAWAAGVVSGEDESALRGLSSLVTRRPTLRLRSPLEKRRFSSPAFFSPVFSPFCALPPPRAMAPVVACSGPWRRVEP